MRLLAATASAPLAALLLSGCSEYGTAAPPCTPTVTTAKPADKVSIGSPGRSSVIEARLTANGKPLSGRSLTFDVLDDDATVHTASGSTGADGTARVDLKRVDPDTLVALLRADEFQASFAGNATYCASDDTAKFHAVRPGQLPVGVDPLASQK